MVPILKELLRNQENWRNLTEENKEQYQYPGWHDSCLGNTLYYAPNITKLPLYSEPDPHSIWSDIQLSKASTSKNKLDVNIGGKTEKMYY